MKILHFSDIHIGMENYGKLDPQTGLSSRLLDFFQTFDFIVETAIKEQVDAVLFAGDAYKTRDPNPTQQRGFGERIRKIAKKIPVILVVGNHDTSNAEGKANTLDIYSALEIDNVYVSRKIEYLKIPTKSGALQVITLPWLHKNDYKTAGEKLKLLYEKIDLSSPAIFLSHCEIEGASFGSEKGMAIANDVTIPLPLLQDKRLSYVALGHLHKHQVLSKDPLIVYSGSPQRIDFGEEKEEKGIILVEIGSIANFRFIPTNARKFLTITVNLKSSDQNPTQTIVNEILKNDITEAVVRLIINIPSDLEENLEMAVIKKSLVGAHYIAGISKNINKTKRIILEMQGVESLKPYEALKKYFQAKNFSNKKIHELENYAQNLLQE
ncbi:exonuclease SbcCD subunit D [Candidatus Daviesbacteria bacterium]|nr:exonuclease SbcCD subunit D [Candidatus Daviesbacteria bacterium]